MTVHNLAEFPFPLRFRRSTRAKRLRVMVRAEGIECVLPLACNERRAVAFLRQHRDWLLDKFGEAAARAGVPRFWVGVEVGRELTLPFQGRETPLIIREGKGRRSTLVFEEGQFRLHLSSGDLEESAVVAEQTIFRWAGAWMRGEVQAAVQRYADCCMLHPRLVRIKRMRTRWGSCGARNDINLNWLLTFAPPKVLEYVVVHELCHIRHRDHSPRFWELVADHLPEYARERQWLKVHGGGLIARFGAKR